MANYNWPINPTTVNSGPVQFEIDGLPNTVNIDTTTPANSTPLPVVQYGPTGVPFDPTKQQSAFILNSVETVVEQDTVTPANSKPFPVINLDNSGSPVNFATETTLAAINTKTPALVGGSVPVTGPLTDTQLRASAVPVSGPLTDTQLRASSVPVSAASLPLPTGAATAALQTSGNTSLTSIDGKVATEATLSAMSAKLPATLGQKAMAASMAVTIASDQSTVPVSASSLPLPTGAATETTLAALNTKINSGFGASTGATRTAAQVGNATGSADFGAGNSSAQTLRVVVATNQTAVPISQASNTGAFSQTTNLINSAQTIAAPLNAVGFKIQAPSTNTENVSFSVGSTATMTAGILMEPGRSEDFDVGSSISVIAPNATPQTVTVLWKIKP